MGFFLAYSTGVLHYIGFVRKQISPLTFKISSMFSLIFRQMVPFGEHHFYSV